MEAYKTTFDLSKELGLKRDAIVKRARRLGIQKRRNKLLFNEDECNEIINYTKKELPPKLVYLEVIKYYPLKTTVTYEVYQSKINNQ